MKQKYLLIILCLVKDQVGLFAYCIKVVHTFLQQAYLIIWFPGEQNLLSVLWFSIFMNWHQKILLSNSVCSMLHCSKLTLKKTNHDCITVVKLPWKSWRRSRPLLCDWCAQEFRFEHQYFLCVFILSVYVKLYFNFISAVLIIHEINIKL